MAQRDDAGWATYEKTIKDPTPLDPAFAAERLKEVKNVFDELGVFFWLGSGTCLGAVREGRFIPWDDEMDTAGVIGMHGLTLETLDRVAEAFRARGFYCPIKHNNRYSTVNFIKDGVRVDWTCHHIVDGKAYEFPGVELPLSLFEHPTEIEFIGETFRIPNPPEEYLRLKYGPEWRTPKGPGFEADVVMKIEDGTLLSRGQRIQRALTMGRLPRPTNRLRVFDRAGKAVSGAEVIVAGVGRTRTDAQGRARFFVPYEAYYAVIVAYPGHREVLYEEVLTPGAGYTYRPGPIVTPEEHYKAGVRALALVKE